MKDLTHEDVVRFLAAWKRAYLPVGLVTPAVTDTIAALEALALTGGVMVVDPPPDLAAQWAAANPNLAPAPVLQPLPVVEASAKVELEDSAGRPLAPQIADADDIPF